MISDIEQMFKNAGVALDTQLLTEGVAELKRQYPLISDNDYQQLIRFDPTYKGGNELGKYGRWILDLYNTFVKDRNAEEKYEKAKAYVAEHPEAQLPPRPAMKSRDRIEDFQKIPELLKDLESHLNDVKEHIQSFKSVADLAAAVNNAVEKDVSVDEQAQKNYKIFREAMADGLKVVYQDNDWIIGIPETYEASSHFKKPVTEWCTAYPEKYEEYMRDYGGKYYIHLNKHTGELYQLHAESNQFKDANDREVNPFNFIEEYPKLKAFFKSIIDPDLGKPRFWILSGYQPTTKEKVDAILDNLDDVDYIPNLTEEDIALTIHYSPQLIRYLKNPSEEEQLKAVSTDGYALEYITNPSLEVQRAAVTENGRAIRYIKNPSEELQLLAVTHGDLVLELIHNPSEKVQMAAIEHDGRNIKNILNPTEGMLLRAVRQNPDALVFMENPSERVKIEAAKQDAFALQYIENPSEKIQMAAINNPDTHGEFIGWIKDPSEAVQLAAIKRAPTNIQYIENPTEKARKLQQKLWG